MDGWALATTGVQGRPRAVHDVALPQGVTTAEFFPLCPKQHAGQSFMPMGTALRIGQVESFMAILQTIGGLPPVMRLRRIVPRRKGWGTVVPIEAFQCRLRQYRPRKAH